MKITDEAKVSRVLDSISSGSTTCYGYGLSMLDETNQNSFSELDFFVEFGDYTAASLFLQGSDDNSTWYNLTGSEVDLVSGYGYSLGVINIINPQDAYLRLGITRDTATVDGAIAIQHSPKHCPVVQDESVEADHSVVSPSHGTI